MWYQAVIKINFGLAGDTRELKICIKIMIAGFCILPETMLGTEKIAHGGYSAPSFI
jgi:hypothetical protein